MSEDSFICENCGKRYEQMLLPFDCVVESKPKDKSEKKEGKPIKSIQVTKTNVSSIPVEWLYPRYLKLHKQMRTNGRPSIIREAEVIENHLKQLGKGDLIAGYEDTSSTADQLEFAIPYTIRQQYQPIIEYRLKEYYTLLERKKMIECELPHVKNMRNIGATKVTASYGNLAGSSGGGLVESPIEKLFIRNDERVERMEQELSEIEEQLYPMHQALMKLTSEQLELIKKKFLVREEPIDYDLIIEGSWGRQKFYEIKTTALIRIAQVLKVI